MPKHKKSKKNSLQRELAKLKKDKVKTAKLRKQLLSRAKEIEEIRKLQREVRSLKGVGTKRRVAKQVATRIGKDAGKVGWKGLKFAGTFVKNVIQAEVKEQDRERAMARRKRK